MRKKITDYTSVYFIGVKGAGMTALAEVLSHHGMSVSGSDVPERFFTDTILERAGVSVRTGFNPRNIPSDTQLVIFSTAYTERNPEIREARKRKILTLSYPEALGEITALFSTSVAIAGTHGKTTVTALTGWILERGGKDPTVVIGAESKNWKSNSRIGSSDIFVFEADEYQNKFRYYYPHTALINNVEFDHPDFFKNEHQYRETFSSLLTHLPSGGNVVANYDDIPTRHIVQKSGAAALWFGSDSLADWQLITRTPVHDGGQLFKVGRDGSIFGEFRTKLIGKHNALNALASIALTYKLGVGKDDITDALASFQGTVRRLEVIGWVRDVLIIDDYAHHPSEIRASLNSLREAYPEKRIYTVFQPHTFSRTEALLREFAESLAGSDNVLLLDIFGSAREKRGKITSSDVARAIRPLNRNINTVRGTEEAVTFMKEKLVPGDILLTMGAGETWRVAESLYKLLG